MNEILEAIKELAGRLGQTTESLWIPFVRYTKMDGLTSIFGFIIFAILGYYLSLKLINSLKTNMDWFMEYWGLLFVIIPIYLGIIFGVICGIQSSVLNFIEPSGASVHNIISSLGNNK